MTASGYHFLLNKNGLLGVRAKVCVNAQESNKSICDT